jgi:membrane protease YdiL (CAAX protease family)
MIAAVAISAIVEFGGDSLSFTMLDVVMWSIQVFFVYIIPILFSMLLFKSFKYYEIGKGGLKRLFAKPDRLAKKLGSISALYGLTQSVNLLTLLVFFLIPRIFPAITTNVELYRFFERTIIETPQNPIGLLVVVFLTVIVAPIFEEFLFRGILYDALKEYGHGIAIFITAILFGLMHSNIHMLFYATAAGFAFGYIRYATNSLFVVTILHLIINAVATLGLVTLSMSEMITGHYELLETISMIYMVAMVTFVVIGIIAFLKKIPVMRKYRIENAWDEVTPKTKVRLFAVSAPMIIMLIMAIDVHANYPLLSRVIFMFRS